MDYPENTATPKAEPAVDQQRLVLDGTVHIEEPEDEAAPRVVGLIELFNRFLGKRD